MRMIYQALFELFVFIIFLTELTTIAATSNASSEGSNKQEPYDEQLAKQLMTFSLLSFCSKEMIAIYPFAMNPRGLKFFTKHYVNDLDTYSLIGYSPDMDAIVIALKGSSPKSLSNFSSVNLVISATEYEFCTSINHKCLVHKGFYQNAQKHQELLEESFRFLRLRFPHSKVYVTGFSMGGATAQLLAPYIVSWDGGRLLDAVYTFGSPRIGQSYYKKWFEENTPTRNFARIMNLYDLVVSIPSSFLHAGREVRYMKVENENRLEYVDCMENPEKQLCKRFVKLFSQSIKDHLAYFQWDTKRIIEKCEG